MATRTKKEETTEPLTVEQIEAMSAEELSKAWTVERAAEKAALKEGNSDFPTPITNYKNSEAAKAAGKKAPADAKPKRQGVTPGAGMVEFYVDNNDGNFRLLGETQHTLSYIAGYTGRGENRWSVADLVKKLVEDPSIEATDVAGLMSSEWSYTLPCVSTKGVKRDRVVMTKLIPGREAPAPQPVAEPVVEAEATEEASKPTRKPRAPRKPKAEVVAESTPAA